MQRTQILIIVFLIAVAFYFFQQFRPQKNDYFDGKVITEVIEGTTATDVNLDTITFSEVSDKIARKEFMKREDQVKDSDSVVVFEIYNKRRKLSFYSIKLDSIYKIITAVERNK